MMSMNGWHELLEPHRWNMYVYVCVQVIASDGGYRTFPVPFPPEGLQIGVAERYEVVCNFAPYAGRQMYLW
jgi:hypothetical protein